MLGRDLVEIHRLGDCLTAEIHEGGRLHQQASLAADRRFADGGFEFDLIDLRAELFGDIVDGDEARVVTGALVLLAGIAETDNDELDAVVGVFFLFEKHKSPVDTKSGKSSRSNVKAY